MVFRFKSRVPKLLMMLAMSILVMLAGTPLKIEASSPFAGGEGTAESPFLIETPEQLSAIRNYSHAHFKLNADIDLSGMSWVPINPFSGVLDGAGYKIIGLTIDSLVGSEVGLFGKTTQTAILKNISLIDVNIEGPKSGTKDDYDYVGALVGRSYGKVINSFASGTVTGYYSVGGLVGTTHGDITHSCADVTVYAPHIDSSEIGGLVGTVYGGETTYSCATGDVISNGYNVGGLVGMYFLDLVTLEQGLIRNCYATGNVVADEIVGGLIGQSSADELYDTYAKGSVTANQYAGGLIGYNWSTEVYNSYSVGKVLPELDEVNYNFSHGFIGHQELFKVYNSFFDMETSGHTYPYAGKPKTTAEMKQRETYLNAGWDFDEVWEIDPLFNDGYPYLKNIQAFITYDGNGHTEGTAPYDGKSYKPGDVVVAKGNEGGLKKTGYIFVGWNTKSDGTGTDYAPGEEFNAREVNVLFAKWLGNPYTVSFDPQGGTVEVTSQEKRYDSPYGLDLDGAPASLPIPEREGYTFLGWYTEPNGQGNRVTDETLVSTMGDHTLYAHWTLSTYDIIFDSMGGSKVDSQQVLHGERAQEPEPPVKTGHTFVGWFTDLSSQEPYDFNEAVTKSITLYAKWNVNQYTVTYDDNGSEGGNVPALVTQDYGTDVVVSDNTGNLTKTGYSFAGWNTARDGSGESYQPGESFPLGAEDITLYAQWSINQYTVTYVDNGSDGGDVPAQVIQDYGTEVTVSDNTEGLTKTGYTFVEWNTKPDGSGTAYRAGDTFTLGASDVTLYAQWSINQYTVTYVGNGSDGGDVPAQVIQDYGTEVTVSDNTGGLTKIGYTFVGWNTKSDGSGTSYQPGDTLTLGASDITLYAQWSINQYTVTYDDNGSDAGEVPAPISQDYGTDVVISGNTGGLKKTGYTFVEWNTKPDGSGTAYQPGDTFKLGASDVTLYAQWSINQYTVTYDGNENDEGTVPASVTQDYGTEITVLDNTGGLTKVGHTFVGWNTASDGSGTAYRAGDTFKLGASDVTLYAQWSINQYTVTYDGNGNDDGTVPESVTQDYGTEITVSDNTGGLTKVGHTFIGWNTALDGSGTSYQPGESFKLGVDNVTLYAQWQKNSYTVSFESNGGSDVDSQTVYYGDTVMVPDKPKRSGFVFDSWHINQDLDAPYDFSTPVTGNLTLYAKWRLLDPVAMPKATPSGGAVLPGTPVELSTETTGATIYYTTDGTEPTTSSTKYTNPIIVTSEMTIKAIAVKEEMRDSDVLSEHYTMAPIPVPMNLTANPHNESVSLNWEAVQIRDVTYAVYKVEGDLAPSDPNDWELVQTGIPSNNFTVTNLTNGTSYVFAVKTVYAGNESDFSNVAQATPVRGTSNSGGSGGSEENIISTDGRITIPVGKSGEIRLGDELILEVSSGAAEQELQITVEKLNDVSALLPEHGSLVSPVYELLKNMSDDFKKPISLTINFDRSKVSEDQRVAIFYYDEENKRWVEVGGIVEGEHINVEVDHFTKFAVLAVDEKEDEEPKEMPKVTFSDIAGHWGEQSIIDAASRKLINGYPDGSFKPNNPVTRAEFTAMLVNTLQLDEISTDLPFTDQDKIGNWAKPAIAVAAQRGLVKGYEDGSFRPDALITRAEMSVMIARVLGLDTNDISSTKFKDDKDIPQWAKSSVAALNELGIVNGRGDNKFVPKETATRTEAIVILLRMLEMEN